MNSQSCVDDLDIALSITQQHDDLTDEELTAVNGGFVCGGMCVLGAISAGAVLFSAGVSVGKALS